MLLCINVIYKHITHNKRCLHLIRFIKDKELVPCEPLNCPTQSKSKGLCMKDLYTGVSK